MNAYALLGAGIAVLAYVPLTMQVWQRKITQNFATYALWGALDAIATVSIVLKDGNFALPLIYVLCCAAILVAILRTRTMYWTWLESLISGLVLICVVIWALSGDRAATVASSLALIIASVPLFLEFWRKPADAPLGPYVAFTVANGISLLAGKDWSVEERFYPGSAFAATLLFVLVALRRYLPRHRMTDRMAA